MADKKPQVPEVLKGLLKNQFAKQLAAGTVTGIISGNIASCIAKPIAFGAGMGIVLLELARYHGYISNMPIPGGGNNMKNCKPLSKEQIESFTTKNKTFTAGFVGGFLMGLVW
ncbi:FUN14 domain-containing protein 2 [Aethina tumida]|uniref:FUN14 domain-containing protein 2 n=1 Tax=Aethina tumida TaxID=116153 RepID=UPI0021498CA4|nr:FUN14 domain-containing protein 2 [Aethina tumida]